MTETLLLGKHIGRSRGTPNRNAVELRQRIQDYARRVTKKYLWHAEDSVYDPLTELVKIGLDPATPLKDRVHCHEVVAEYMHPKRKAIVFSGEVTVSHEQWLAQIGEEIDPTIAIPRYNDESDITDVD